MCQVLVSSGGPRKEHGRRTLYVGLLYRKRSARWEAKRQKVVKPSESILPCKRVGTQHHLLAFAVGRVLD